MPVSNAPVTRDTPLPDLISYAQMEAERLLPDEEFTVRDLFLGYEWNRIYTGDRTRLGSAFFAYAQGEGAGTIAPLGKTPQNQQRYKKL